MSDSSGESEDYDVSDVESVDSDDREEEIVSNILTSDEDFVSIQDIQASIKEKKNGSPYLTKYEKTKILGLRAQQLANGSLPFVTVPKHISDTCDIAKIELQQRKLPFIIRRGLPNSKNEYWRLSDMIYF